MESKKENVASIYVTTSAEPKKDASPTPSTDASFSKGGAPANAYSLNSKPIRDEDDEQDAFTVNTRPNPLSYVFFTYIDPLIARGRKRRLNPEDCMRLEKLKTEALHENFARSWKRELDSGAPDIRKAVLRGHWPIFLLTAAFYLISQATTFAGPLLLNRIVAGLECRQVVARRGLSPDAFCEPVKNLYLYSIGLFGAPFIAMFTDNHSQFLLNLIGTKMRNALMAAIYRKCLRASNASLQRESAGKIVTLMSNDAQKIQDVMLAVHACWGSPLYIMAILALLYQQVQWATFVGLFVMMLLGPVTGIVATKLAGYRRSILQYVDRRISIVSEIIPGIRVIKFYAWEKSFLGRVQDLRSNEIRIMKKIAVLSGAFGMLLFSGPVAVGLFCFMSYTLAGNTLTTAKAYAALAYFTMLRFPMSFLPMFIQQLVTANVAMKRIQGFLLQPEAPEEEDSAAELPPGSVVIKGADFAWELQEERERRIREEAEALKRMEEEKKKKKRGPPRGPPGGADLSTDGGPPGRPGMGGPPALAAPAPKLAPADPTKPWVPTLHDIHLDVKSGHLVMVAGAVGSGKSSLLAALIRNIAKVKGSVQVAGSVAYVAQTSWIVNDTLRENVLLGAPFDPLRYRNAIEVAQLESDLRILPQGDMTEIGERGITLSGGQKQRVSIARAVYRDADIYVLDDPLSAVDSHVGKALFEKCIRGALRDKTVILVTNALYYLPFADHILWLEDGRIAESGLYPALMAHGGRFADLVSKNVVTEDQTPADTAAAAAADSAAAAAAVTAAAAKKAAGPAEPSGIAGDKAAAAAAAGGRNLTGIEEREQGNVAWPVIREYGKAAGGVKVALLVVALFAVEQCLKVGTDLWVGVWTQDRAHRSRSFYIGLYFCWGVAYSLLTFCRSVTYYFATLEASKALHNMLIHHVLNLPMAFFDTNPSGRVVNRFSRDVEIMDSVLPASVIQFLGCFANLLTTFFLLCIAMPYFTIAFVPLMVFYIVLQRYYIPSARELQRIESITRSPIYALFGEAITGVATIRAYRTAGHFTAMSDQKIYENAAAFITQKAAASWLSMRLDVIGLITVTLAGLLCVNGNINPGIAGLVLVYALDITKYLKFGTSMASKSESDFNSVERIVQYLTPEPEAASDTDKAVLAAMPPAWPSHGAISVEKLEMRYRPDTPLVLRGLTFSVAGGEKIGICGRTGSGKSSLFIAFFRMVEPTGGRIVIDGVDIATLGLGHLRSLMSMIPQDPFMFSGSVRRNLDPFSEQSDGDLWTALASVGLKPAIEAMQDKLEATVVDGGSNFSQGQRQLICLARALLRNSRVLMMDEATASVDMDTDALIQQTVREKFQACSVLTIAHRLNTIMDSDKVLVMDAGIVAEYDTPMELLATANSKFAKLVDETGRNNSAHLRNLASVKSVHNRSALSLAGTDNATPSSSSNNLTALDKKD